MNHPFVLGLEIRRDKEKRIIMVLMTKNIEELIIKYPDAMKRKRNVPMPTSGYIFRDYEFEKLPEEKKKLLSQTDIAIYMSLIGTFIWIQGIRMEIMFAVLYLSWFTKSPRDNIIWIWRCTL
jgi:hypothetical protein